MNQMFSAVKRILSILLYLLLAQYAAAAVADNPVLTVTDSASLGSPQSAGAPAETTDVPAVEAEAGISHENLSNGYTPWSSIYFDAQKRLAQRQSYYGSLRETRRFSLNDTEAIAGLSQPLTSRWTLVLEGTVSPSHNVLAKWSTLGQVQYAFDNGWGAHLGLRHSVYDNALTNLLMVTGERYWSNYRLAYTLYQGSLAGASSAISHRVQFTRFYGDRSWIAVALSTGDELENIGAAGVLRSQVHGLALSGGHWLNNKWAGTYEIGQFHQGDLYTRTGARLGLRHQF